MSKKKRIPISLDKLLDAYPVDRCIPSSIVSQNFEHSYRNKKPVIIAGGALTWLGINTALGAVYTILSLVEECEIDALVALDGRQFLKNDLCKFERIDLTAGITRILCRKESEICIKEGNLVPGFDEERTYLRIYFDSHPKLLGQIDLSFLVMLMSLTLTTEANSDQIHQFEQQPLFINPSTFPLVPSFVKPVELLSSSTGIGVDTSPFQLKNIGLWASSEGCVTPLHFDLCHGFLAQIVGKKTFILASSEDFVLNRYWKSNRKESRENNGTTNAVDFALWLEGDVEERKKHPLLDEVAWFIASLSTGDILYTPPGWWHYVISETASVSVLIPCDPIPRFDILPSNSLSV